MELEHLKTELRYAYEGLQQMQEPDAGYFEDPEDKQPHEWKKYCQDVQGTLDQIEKLERKIWNEEKTQARLREQAK